MPWLLMTWRNTGSEQRQQWHYDDVIMTTIASQITGLTVVYSTVYSDPDQRNHQSSASLAFVWGIHRGPVNSPHKWPVTRKMFPFDDVIMDSDRILRLRGCDTVSSSMEILRYHLIPMWNIYAFPMYIIDIWHELFVDLRWEFRFNFMSKISNIGSTI